MKRSWIRQHQRVLLLTLAVVATSCESGESPTAVAYSSAPPSKTIPFVDDSEIVPAPAKPPPTSGSSAGQKRPLEGLIGLAEPEPHPMPPRAGAPPPEYEPPKRRSAPQRQAAARAAPRAEPLAQSHRPSSHRPSAPRPADQAAAAKQRAAAKVAREREEADHARRSALARARAKDLTRRSDDSRLPLVPRHHADDRFRELRILEHSSVREMTFYDYGVNPTIATDDTSVSTFAVDVDSASYGVARSYLQKGTLPDEGAIRVEEMINAFDYAYAAPEKEPFLVQAEAFPSPNRKGYHVLHLGIKGRELSMDQRKPAALVFVVDVSGSMAGENRLGLVKRSLTMLTRQLDGRDSVGVIAYGTTARAVLEPTRAGQEGKRRIGDAITGLATEGSTNVEAGLELGYAMAARSAGTGASARVILCSDGVANAGATAAETILERVRAHAERGVTISTIGFGMGHYNDVLMERLADKGNGNYAYVDNIEAAQRVFVEQLGATLEVIAKDVKIQVVFDKNQVARYRLLGFENRMLAQRDFDNDRVDAGEIGAGHTVTAMYEIKLRKGIGDGKIGTLRVRYKAPSGNRSDLVERGMPMSIVRSSYAEASAPTKLSMVVAAFAEKLRGSYWARNQSYAEILKLWDQIPESLRLRQDVAELRSLIVTASTLDNREDRFAALLPVAKMDFDRVPVLY